MDTNVQNALGNLLVAAVPVLTTVLSVIGYLVGAWLKAHKEQLQAKLGKDNWDTLVGFGEIGVKWAEQKSIIGEIENEGSAKKSLVLAFLQRKADELGMAVSVEDLDAIIESAIREGVHKSWDFAKVTTEPDNANTTPATE